MVMMKSDALSDCKRDQLRSTVNLAQLWSRLSVSAFSRIDPSVPSPSPMQNNGPFRSRTVFCSSSCPALACCPKAISDRLLLEIKLSAFMGDL